MGNVQLVWGKKLLEMVLVALGVVSNGDWVLLLLRKAFSLSVLGLDIFNL